jgi:hypothetical protein
MRLVTNLRKATEDIEKLKNDVIAQGSVIENEDLLSSHTNMLKLGRAMLKASSKK